MRQVTKVSPRNLRRLTQSAEPLITTSRHPHATRFTNQFEIKTYGPNLDTYRVMDEMGKIIVEDYDSSRLDKASLLTMYRNMYLGNMFDNIFYDAQRQGRISFYMTNFGEEGAQVGCAEGLDDGDLAFVQYRELGFFIHRGVPMQQLADTNYSNKDDPNHGKQMPVHYGSKARNIVTVSSTLATQMPQAAGAAYAYKRENKGKLVACFFGEGAASEGDAHTGFAFSATLRAPCLWLCRNNGFAISTPIADQYTGDALSGRGLAYGMGVIRVDGNDVLAVRDSVQEARKFALENSCPVMVELMTYRGGHHSTSDDATRYRDPEDIVYWAKVDNPIVRMQHLLFDLGYMTKAQDDDLRAECRKTVLLHFRSAEKKLKPKITKMFDDVYKDLTPALEQQQDHLLEHLKKYPRDYGVEEYSET